MIIQVPSQLTALSTRRDLVDHLRKTPGGLTYRQLAQRMACTVKTVRRAFEDLETQGAVFTRLRGTRGILKLGIERDIHGRKVPSPGASKLLCALVRESLGLSSTGEPHEGLMPFLQEPMTVLAQSLGLPPSPLTEEIPVWCFLESPLALHSAMVLWPTLESLADALEAGQSVAVESKQGKKLRLVPHRLKVGATPSACFLQAWDPSQGACQVLDLCNLTRVQPCGPANIPNHARLQFDQAMDRTA
jgi:hypothetical protein